MANGRQELAICKAQAELNTPQRHPRHIEEIILVCHQEVVVLALGYYAWSGMRRTMSRTPALPMHESVLLGAGVMWR